MSTNDVYEYIQGEYQAVSRIHQEPVSNADITFFKDLNLVKWAGFNIELWTAETGGTQLTQGIDFTVQLLDASVQGPAQEQVYAGFSILTPLYYNVPLYLTASIVGAYTTRPYRPSYTIITSDQTITPVSHDDSVIADASSGNIAISLEDGTHINQRYSIICKGLGTVTVVGTGISSASFTGVGVSWLWDGNEWMPLAAPGAREGGFYYDYVPAFIRPDTDPISDTIPNFLATYGEGFFYVGLEFTYQGTTDKTNGTFAIADDEIDKYAVLAVDIAGSDSTLSVQWQWATDTMVAIETGSDFTDLNLWAVFRWEKVTYGGYGAWANTAEAPPYGEAITSEQELYLDGTKEFVSSDGNAPVVDVVDYLPAFINVDGSETPEANSKWPGQRGAYGFFGEYENVAGGGPTPASADVTAEGDWTKITATGTGGGSAGFTYSALSTVGYTLTMVRQGSAPLSAFGSASGDATITWATKSVAYTNGAIMVYEKWLGDVVIIGFHNGASGVAGSALYAGVFGSGFVGESTYYRNFMVADLPYPVPYVQGTHQPAKLQFNKDWAESTEWTIQGWVRYADDTPATQTFFSTRPNTGFNNYFEVRNGSGGGMELISNDGSSTTTALTGYSSGNWNHIKVVFTSASNFAVYINGGAVQNKATNVPDVEDMQKMLNVGNRNITPNAPADGYIQDFTIQPGIDTSDAHYLSGLPFYNPNKTYGKNASWSIDSRGNISGNNQVSGSIIQDEEINGQWVTRWAGGRMEIANSETLIFSGSSTAFIDINFSVQFTGGVKSITTNGGQVDAVDNFYSSATEVTGTSFRFVGRLPSAGSGTSQPTYWNATGRWK